MRFSRVCTAALASLALGIQNQSAQAAGDLFITQGGASRAAVVIKEANGVAGRAVEIFLGRIQERSGARLPLVREGGKVEPEVVIALGVRGKAPALAAAAVEAGAKLGPDGYAIAMQKTGDKTVVSVVGADEPGLVFGVGALLRHLRFQGKDVRCSLLEKPLAAEPWLKENAIYYASHCGNDYENGKDADIVRDVEDAALWGINTMWIWMIPVEHYRDLSDPNQKETKGWDHWRRIILMMKTAKGLGMRTGALICSNVSFLNFITPDMRATGGIAVNPAALVCPSIPKGREAVLKTNDIRFRLAKEAGVAIDGVLYYPDDSGGCECEKCKPWWKTALKLAEETAAIARKHYPGVKFYFCDNNLPGDLIPHLNANPPGDWCMGICTRSNQQPRGLKDTKRTYTFQNFSSIYYFGFIGGNPIPSRVLYDMKVIKGAGIIGLMQYSEGRYQHMNYAFQGQFGWDIKADANAVAASYARYHFGVSDETAAAFAQAVMLIEKETPSRSNYNFTPGTSKTIYEAFERCRKEMADWPMDRYYFDVLRLRAVMGHLCFQMGTPADLRQQAANADIARVRQIRDAYKEFQEVYESFFQKYGSHTFCGYRRADFPLSSRYKAVWSKNGKHTYEEWLKEWVPPLAE